MFNIPAINNQKEALTIHLGLDEENNEIEPLDDTPGLHNKRIRTFRHKTDVYQVAHVSQKIGGHAVVNFNSNHWEIRKFPSTKKKQSMSNQSQSKKVDVNSDEFKEFIKYVLSFYGEGEIYDFKFTYDEVVKATNHYLEITTIDFDGDTIDREAVREIVFQQRKE